MNAEITVEKTVGLTLKLTAQDVRDLHKDLREVEDLDGFFPWSKYPALNRLDDAIIDAWEELEDES